MFAIKKPCCPSCFEPISFKNYLIADAKQIYICPSCNTASNVRNVKLWWIYVYYNITFILILSIQVIEIKFQLPNITDMSVVLIFLGTLKIGHYLYKPSIFENHNKESFFRIYLLIGFALMATIIQYVLIAFLLYSIYGKSFINLFKS